MSMPIYGDMKDITFQNHPFYPVVESPGVVFIVKKEDSSNAAKAVMEAVFQGWPVLLLTLIMAALSGIVVWALVSVLNVMFTAVKQSIIRGNTEFNLNGKMIIKQINTSLSSLFVGYLLEPGGVSSLFFQRNMGRFLVGFRFHDYCWVSYICWSVYTILAFFGAW